ncbi:MAG: hypothetical protein ACRD18_00635 [Terriglobia bacterium]
MAFPDDEDFGREVHETNEPVVMQGKSNGLNEWLLVVTLVLILGIAVAVGYTVHTQHSEHSLAAANGQLAAELTQTQSQLTALTEKLNALSAPAQAQPAAPADETLNAKPEQRDQPAARVRPHVHHAHAPAMPSKWQKQMQGQLTADQQRIAAAEQAIAKTRVDMASSADSARSNLNRLGGSVARDHAELVALERQGQRNYYEFDLFKSKQFTREGPISLALRHTDTKHGNYDVELLVNDSKLTKKHVDLYEPVTFATGASPQPLELVVNRIDKNHVHGYVSAPKSYSERAAATSVPATPQFSLTPAPVPASAQAVAATTPAGTQASPELTVNRQ